MNKTNLLTRCIRGVTAILGVAAVMFFGTVAPATAADYVLDTSYTWQMSVKQAYANDGRTFLLAELNSLLLPQPDTPLARPRVMTCPAVLDLGAETFGFCVQTDADGDQIYVAISSVPAPQEQ